MKRATKSIALLASAFVLLAAAPSPVVPALAPSEIVDAAPASDWVNIAADELLVMDLAPDAGKQARRVVIQLMPAPFSQGWIANIRKLAAAHWWDGTSINRVQDNYVVQWGEADGKKPLPPALATTSQDDYSVATAKTESSALADEINFRNVGTASSTEAIIYPDVYPGSVARFQNGWPIAQGIDAKWPVHCYGMVGVGRDMPPDSGSGAELYTVIGQAPRHLDRNIALVGRVISGIENLSSLPRGTGPLGFYENPEQRVVIKAIRLASELPAGQRPRFQYLSTENATFARYADARANRRDPFFIHPAGSADICNVPVPIRKAP
ncbi:MAG: peptidylprolyl isomerase [Sphingomonadales bacterium]|nr:peptidylprolyl isomerase [Sphingomonadales bacterium]